MIKSARERLKMTQAQMASMVGINRSYLSELEAGRKPVQDWIISRVGEVETRMGSLNRLLPREKKTSQSTKPLEFSVPSFLKYVEAMNNEELVTLFEYVAERVNNGHPLMQPVYRSTLDAIIPIVSTRMNLKAK